MTEDKAKEILSDLYETHRHMFYLSLRSSLVKDQSERLNVKLFHTFKYFFTTDIRLNDSGTLISIVEKTQLIKLFYFFYPYWVAFILMNDKEAEKPMSKKVTEYYNRFFEEYVKPKEYFTEV